MESKDSSGFGLIWKEIDLMSITCSGKVDTHTSHAKTPMCFNRYGLDGGFGVVYSRSKLMFNSLPPWNCGSNSISVISEHMLRIKFMQHLFEIVRTWMSQKTFHDKSTLVQVMVWYRQTTSHSLSQYQHIRVVIWHHKATMSSVCAYNDIHRSQNCNTIPP